MNNAFPIGLKYLPVWILWKLEERGGKATKVPYSANYDGRASSTNPSTWSSFDKAFRKYQEHSEEYNGLGIVISKDFRIVFIDIDDCIKEGALDDRAEDILKAFELQSTYMEYSQSGKGIHILALGEIPRSFKNSELDVEMYSEKRFCAMTGDVLNASELHENASALTYIFNKYKTPDKTKNAHNVPIPVNLRSDEWVIRKAFERGGLFPSLYSGQWKSLGYTSQSEADLALCMILAFWTDGSVDSIERIFRSSGLYREKWEREDYRESTIQTALGLIEETISEYKARMKKEKGETLENAFVSQW